MPISKVRNQSLKRRRNILRNNISIKDKILFERILFPKSSQR